MTQRIAVELGDLKANPFKKQIQGGRLDAEKVKRLEESVTLSGFWDGLVGRKIAGEIEIAFGHHRVVAAINRLGKKYKTSFLLDNYSDEQMVVMLANENSASEGASDAEQIDTVVMARKWLRSNPSSCKVHSLHDGANDKSSREDGRGGKVHEHGSERCITAFLGEKNWSITKVHHLLATSGLTDDAKSILRNQVTGTRDHKPQPGTLSIGAAPAVAKLPKPMQTAVVAAIRDSKVGLPAQIVKTAVAVAVEAATVAAKPEQRAAAASALDKLNVSRATTAAVSAAAALPTKQAQAAIVAALKKDDIPAALATATATRITEAASDVLEKQQKTAATAAIKAAEEKQRRDEELRRSKDLNDVIQRMTNALMDFDMPFEENDMLEVTRLRGEAAAGTLRGLISALRRVAARFDAHAEKLEAPAQKRLSA